MDENEGSSSSPSSSHNHMHQLTAEHDGTPGNTHTLAGKATPSDRQLSRNYSNTGFEHDPSGPTRLTYINESHQHQHHQTPSRIPISIRPVSSSSSLTSISVSSFSLGSLSTLVSPPTLLPHSRPPLSRIQLTPVLRTEWDSAPAIHMSQPPIQGQRADTDVDTDSERSSDQSQSLLGNLSMPSAPTQPISLPRSTTSVVHHTESPVAGPSRLRGQDQEEETSRVAAGVKRSRSQSQPDLIESSKRSRLPSSDHPLNSSLAPTLPTLSPREEISIPSVLIANHVANPVQSSPQHHAAPPLGTVPSLGSPLVENPVPHAAPIPAGVPPVLYLRFQPEPYIPSMVPPINLISLGSIEALDSLRRADIRHELQYKDVAITPPTSLTRQALHRARLRSRGFEVSPRDVSMANEYHQSVMYWMSLGIEAETGCRCAKWQVTDDGHPEHPMIVEFHALPATECICGRWMRELSGHDWRRQVRRSGIPSRFRELIIELRKIVHHLMGAVARVSRATQYSHSGDAAADAQRYHEAQEAAEVVQRLLLELDPKHLTEQLRRGVLGVELFTCIADAMKHHCAPLRDAMVDSSVQLACDGHMGLAFKRLFESAEAMKVDIVNHHLHQYQPTVAAHGPRLQRISLNHVLGDTYLERSETCTWLKNASRRVIANTPQVDRVHLMGRCECASSAELVLRSAVEGVVDLIFARIDTTRTVGLWPIDQSTIYCCPPESPRPEVLAMDLDRIRVMATMALDIINTNMILLYFRTLFVRTNRDVTTPELSRQVESARVDLEVVQSEMWQNPVPRHPHLPAEWAIRLARRVVFPDQEFSTEEMAYYYLSDEEARTINNIAIQLESFRSTPVARNAAKKQFRGLLTLLLTNVMMAKRHVDFRDSFPRQDTSFGNDCLLRRHPVSRRTTTSNTSSLAGSNDATPSPPSTSSSELSVEHQNNERPTILRATQIRQSGEDEATAILSTEEEAIDRAMYSTMTDRIRDLVSTVEKLVTLNLNAFLDFYQLKGMLAGSGQPTEDELNASQLWQREYDQGATSGMLWETSVRYH